MGRSQVKYNRTHGRGRGRGGRGDGSGRADGSTDSGRRSGQRALQSNAYRFEERVENDDHAGGDPSDVGAFSQRQYFAGEEQHRDVAEADGAYFQTSTVKQWEADEEDETESSARGKTMDFDWIADQLRVVSPSIRYQIDPKYCVDLDFTAMADAIPEEDNAPAASVAEEELTVALATSSTAKAAEIVDELDELLALGSTAAAPVGARASAPAPSKPIAPKAAPSPVLQSQDQLEDWLDDMLDA